jgi:hypothetical protein
MLLSQSVHLAARCLQLRLKLLILLFQVDRELIADLKFIGDGFWLLAIIENSGWLVTAPTELDVAEL